MTPSKANLTSIATFIILVILAGIPAALLIYSIAAGVFLANAKDTYLEGLDDDDLVIAVVRWPAELPAYLTWLRRGHD